MRKVALITASASGLAVAFSRQLAQDGFDLVLNYRKNKSGCEQLAQTLEHHYAIDTLVHQADMTQKQDIEHLVDATKEHFGRIDILIHSAGPFIFQRKRLTEYADHEWEEMIDGNLTSAFYLFRKIIPLMRPQGFGRIVTIGFDRIEQAPGWGYRSAYAAAKVGLASLTKTVAIEERENGITANMICPGDIRGAKKEAQMPLAQTEGYRTPVGGDLAAMISFLVKPEARFVTGNILSLTNGEDVLGHYDSGKKEVFDPIAFEIGTMVYVLPWNKVATVTDRLDRVNRRSLYTVQTADQEAQFTVDQLEELT